MAIKAHNLAHASAGLQRVVATSLRKAAPGTAPVLAWPLVCGSAVALRTQAIDFVDSILRVEVPDKGWRTELMALAPQYLAVVNRFSKENVKRIEFVIAGR